MAEVEVKKHEGWAELVLNRPDRRNAINGPFGLLLAEHLHALNSDVAIEAILLRGADGCFCSGLDLKEFNADPEPDWRPDVGDIWRAVHRALYETEKPVIAALERFAINGGAALALAADILLVGKNSFLQVGEVQQGMAAPYNLAWLKLRYSEAIISQLTLVGRRFTGEELLRMGVAYATPNDAEVLSSARALMKDLSKYPPGALSRIKRTMRSYVHETADDWFDHTTKYAENMNKPSVVKK